MNKITLKVKGLATDEAGIVRDALEGESSLSQLHGRMTILVDSYTPDDIGTINSDGATEDERNLIYHALGRIPILLQMQKQLGIIVVADGRRVGLAEAYGDVCNQEMALAV